MRDNRDPRILGEALLESVESQNSIDPVPASVYYDWHRDAFSRCPNYQDETTIEKYGDPRLLPSTLPN